MYGWGGSECVGAEPAIYEEAFDIHPYPPTIKHSNLEEGTKIS